MAKISTEYLKYNTMSLKELRSVIAKNNKTIRDRARNLKSDPSPSYMTFIEEGGLENARKLNLNEARKYLKRQIQFLNSKSSSLKGWKSIRKEWAERVGLPKSEYRQYGNFWSVYSKLKEYRGIGFTELDSPKVHKFIQENMDKYSIEELSEELDEFISLNEPEPFTEFLKEWSKS
jgi:hypothetical protein